MPVPGWSRDPRPGPAGLLRLPVTVLRPGQAPPRYRAATGLQQILRLAAEVPLPLGAGASELIVYDSSYEIVMVLSSSVSFAWQNGPSWREAWSESSDRPSSLTMWSDERRYRHLLQSAYLTS